MYTLKLGPATAVVLTDRRIIKQLLEKRSAISSDRPVNEVGRRIGEGDHILLMDNTPAWRLLRKQIHQDLTIMDEEQLDKEWREMEAAAGLENARLCVRWFMICR